MDRAVFLIDATGVVHGLYTDEIDLHQLGPLQVSRAGTVEFDGSRQGWVVTILGTGEVLGPFSRRDEALRAEVAHLTRGLGEVSVIGATAPLHDGTEETP